MIKYIHLAGTNGKGSTAQYIANILGVRHSVGLFTSPHIFSPVERFQINGQAMPDDEYNLYMHRMMEGGSEHYFTLWTRVALQWFTDRSVEYAVVETGLGGRKDPTNVIESDIQVITPISFDHTQLLGDTIQKIAREKCGIIKWGGTVVSHPQPKEALDVIKKTCERLSCDLIVLDEKRIAVRKADTEGQVFSFRYKDLHLQKVSLHAIADVQVQNACVAAICGYELGVPADEIRDGIEQTVLAAREELQDNVLMDAAHNEAAMRELAHTVGHYFNKKNITVLTAVMEDKDVGRIAGIVESFADTVICTCADKKRGMPAKEYAKYFRNAQPMEDPRYAFQYAWERAKRKKGIIVVCGSFYLIPFVMEEMKGQESLNTRSL